MPEPTPVLPPAGYHGVRSVGRPSLLTPDAAREFETLIRAGNFFETVCDFVGVERATARGWMRRGAKEHKRLAVHGDVPTAAEEVQYLEFFSAIRRAAASADIVDLNVIGEVARGRPRRVTRRTHPDGTQEEIIEDGLPPNHNAAAWRLSRRRPQQFGQTAPIKVQHEGTKGGEPIRHDVTAQVTFYLPDNGRGPGAGPLTEDTAETGD